MAALSQLFDQTSVLVPVTTQVRSAGEIPLTGHRLRIIPLPVPYGNGWLRKLLFPVWCVRCLPIFLREFSSADAIHAPIPGDVGTIGMLLAWLFRKPLFVRHCGNWLRPKTTAEVFWRWFMERIAGGKNVMLATGGTDEVPSKKNPAIQWIFSTSLTEQELLNGAHPRRYPADRQLRLILVARQEKPKGTGTVIQSLALLLKPFPSVSLEVVGEGSALAEFKQLAIEFGVADRVHFAGKLNHDQVMERHRNAHLFVYPTTASEGFPKAVLEALAAGLPVIATRVSVIPHLLSNGCGILLDASTPSAVARGITDALKDPSHYEAMSQKAIARAQKYSLEAWSRVIGNHLFDAWGLLRKSHNNESLTTTGSRPFRI